MMHGEPDQPALAAMDHEEGFLGKLCRAAGGVYNYAAFLIVSFLFFCPHSSGQLGHRHKQGRRGVSGYSGDSIHVLLLRYLDRSVYLFSYSM